MPITSLKPLSEHLPTRATTRDESSFALLFIDLNPSRLTDGLTSGSLHGSRWVAYRDRLLQKITDSLQSQLREQDLISRVSETEFVIALRSDPLENVPQVASRLANVFNQPICLDEQQFQVSCNIGVSFYPEDGQDTDELIQKANAAMQQAKAHATWVVQLHPSETSQAIRRRLQIEQALQHSDLVHQLEMVYQPQWDCVSDRLYGFEGLVRWHHPTLGEISPQEFIPIAEEIGCIYRVTHVAIAESLRLTRQILDQYGVVLRPSVNVSAQEFEEFHRLYKIIEEQLHHFQLPGDVLTIELTESVFLQQSEQLTANMTRFRARGLCIALDDFGTGFSCLNYLLDLPLNVLKIDRAFVQDLDRDPRRRGIVQAIAAMAKSLDMRCVTEGVETLAEFNCLKSFGCSLFQGHIVSSALSAQFFLDFFHASLTPPFLSPQP